MRGEVIRLAFKDRSQGTERRSKSQTMSHNDIKQTLLSIKQNILEDLIVDIEKCFDKRQSNVLKWGAFDIRMFPESETMVSDHCKDDILKLGSYYGAPFNVLKSKDDVLQNSLCPAIISEELFVHEYYAVIRVMRDRFKQQIKKMDIYEKRVKVLSETQSSETGSSVGDSPQGMTQREAWIEFLSAYGESYPNMAIVIRVMLEQLTNSADAEQYFSWHKNLLGNLRDKIDV